MPPDPHPSSPASQSEKAGRNNLGKARAAERAERVARYRAEVEHCDNGLTIRPLSPEDVDQVERARARRREHPEAAR